MRTGEGLTEVRLDKSASNVLSFLKTAPIKGDKKAHIWGLAIMLGGASLCALLLFSVNELIDFSLKDQEKSSGISFETKKSLQPSPVKKAPKKTRAKPPSEIARPNLSQIAGGLSFGLDKLGGGELDVDESLFKNIDDMTFSAANVDVPPILQSSTSVKYPDNARSEGIQGFVTIRLLVNKRGIVARHELIEVLPEGYFEAAAISTIKSWKFKPAEYQGKPVQVWLEQTIRFDLK